MLCKKEKEILEFFSANEIEVSPRPFARAADALGMAESELVDSLCRMEKKGVIRGLRGVIDHRRAGYAENALVAWRIGPGQKLAKDEIVSGIFISDDRISHCYERRPHEEFDYNVFTMMHAKTRKEIKDFVRKTAAAFSLEHEILFTEKELKKEKLALGKLLCRH